MAFLPHLGVQNDEALFVTPLYQRSAALYTLNLGHSHFPLMIMSYLGTLKMWIYRPIFREFGAGVGSLRIPVLLAGAASVWLLFLLLRRAAGVPTALIGCGLLATDAIYLLTSCFDWGPVALQHLLLTGGMLLLIRFYQQGGDLALAAGFFLWGLAMWDKALAVWMLSGFGIAGLVVFWRPIFAVTGKRRLLIAAAGFALGALPLVIYNAANHWGTFHHNFKRDTSEFDHKAFLLKLTLEGDGLMGYMTSEDSQTQHPHAPRGWLEQASARISAVAGHPRKDLLPYALLLAILAAPFVGSLARRGVAFGLIAMAVAWAQMVMTAGAGGSVHHVILLWPLPEMVIAISLGALCRRLGRAGIPAVGAIVGVVMLSGCLLINQYHVMMLRNGGAQAWSDAIFALADFGKRAPAAKLYCMDWGIYDGLSLLGAGKLPLDDGINPIANPELSADDREAVRRLIAEPGAVFLAHTKEFEFFQGVSEKLVQFAEQSGYLRETLASIPDTYGRPTFVVYRFVPVKAAAP